MIAALLLPILLGMSALAVDVGSYAAHRRTLQNDADAIALAGARDLPNAANAQASALKYAQLNGLSASDITVTVTGGNTNPKISVDVKRPHQFSFIGALGVGPKTVGAHAASIKATPTGLGGLMPWAITQDTLNQSPSGTVVSIHGVGQGPGNFGGFDIDGRGGNVYRDTIKYGSTGVACAVNTTNCNTSVCPGTYPSPCAQNAGACTGPDCTTEPGLKTGPTRQGLDYRFSLTSSQCSSFSQVFSLDTGTTYNFNPGCNPWVRSGACPVPDDGATLCSRRVIIIPVIDQFGNGRKTATIQRFALFFIESYSGADVTGRFVTANANVGALIGTSFDPQSTIFSVKMTE